MCQPWLDWLSEVPVSRRTYFLALIVAANTPAHFVGQGLALKPVWLLSDVPQLILFRNTGNLRSSWCN
jgi:hypothetical protein